MSPASNDEMTKMVYQAWEIQETARANYLVDEVYNILMKAAKCGSDEALMRLAHYMWMYSDQRLIEFSKQDIFTRNDYCNYVAGEFFVENNPRISQKFLQLSHNNGYVPASIAISRLAIKRNYFNIFEYFKVLYYSIKFFILFLRGDKRAKILR